MITLPDCPNHRGNVLEGVRKCFCRNPKVGKGGLVYYGACLDCPKEIRDMSPVVPPLPDQPKIIVSDDRAAVSGCGGCQERKEAMNNFIPGSGDAFEKYVTKPLGIKFVFDKAANWLAARNRQGNKP